MRWADTLVKYTMPAIRAAFRPADFARRDRVRLIFGDHMTLVSLVAHQSRAFGGARRWLICPYNMCGRKTQVVMFDPFGGVWGCARCLRVRSRPCLVRAPHLRANVRVEGARAEEVR